MTDTDDKASAPKHLVSLGIAANYMQVCAKTVRRRIDDGTFTGYRIGPRLIRVDLDEVEAYLSGHEVETESDQNVGA